MERRGPEERGDHREGNDGMRTFESLGDEHRNTDE